MAVLNFIAPLYIFYQATANQIFQAPAKFIITFVLVWIIIALACWLGFQIWWNRKDKVSMTIFPDNDFLATPVFSHFVQTLGEWLGTLVAVIGFSFSLLVTIILGSEGNYLSQVLGIWFLNNSAISIIVMPIYGFLIIVIGRVFAETLRALVSIVKNTKKRKTHTRIFFSKTKKISC